jgi:putative transposase
VAGATYFFTLVTYQRCPLLVDEYARSCLRTAIYEVRAKHPFRINGFCLLPDHLHTIWTLPEGDNDYPHRWRAIKGHFSRNDRRSNGSGAKPAGSRKKRGEATIWQRRFWEHLIRNEDDLQRHLDYLHFNPIKHGHVDLVLEWPWSSFHRLVREGIYSKDWGGSDTARTDLKTVGE